MQCYRLVEKDEFSTQIGTVGNCCAVNGSEVCSRWQEPQWRNFAGRRTCLPAKRTGRRGQPNGVTDVTNPRLGLRQTLDRTSTVNTVEGQSSNLEVYPRSDWQPMKSVTKHRCNVLIFADTNDNTIGGIQYHLQPACDFSRHALQHHVAIVNSRCQASYFKSNQLLSQLLYFKKNKS